MSDKLKIKEVIGILRKRLLLIILSFICLNGLIIISTLFVMKPTYQYSIQVLAGSLSNDEEGTSANRVQENRQLALSYMDIIKSHQIMVEVKKQLNIAGTTSELLEQVSVSNKDNSQIISISVKDSDPNLAKDIAQTVARESVTKFKDYANVSSLNILNDSGVPEEELLLFPKPKFVIVISFVISTLGGLCLAFLREHFDDNIYNDKDLEGLEVLFLGRVNLKIKRRKQVKKAKFKNQSYVERGEHIG